MWCLAGASALQEFILKSLCLPQPLSDLVRQVGRGRAVFVMVFYPNSGLVSVECAGELAGSPVTFVHFV